MEFDFEFRRQPAQKCMVANAVFRLPICQLVVPNIDDDIRAYRNAYAHTVADHKKEEVVERLTMQAISSTQHE